MKYLLTGDLWNAETALRMGVVQEIAASKAAALEVAIGIANRIAACGPLGVKATLAAAHLAMNESADAVAYAKLRPNILSFSDRKTSSKGARQKLKTGPRIPRPMSISIRQTIRTSSHE
jgi:enoyl-CoA hydratase/carnithine racemase